MQRAREREESKWPVARTIDLRIRLRRATRTQPGVIYANKNTTRPHNNLLSIPNGVHSSRSPSNMVSLGKYCPTKISFLPSSVEQQTARRIQSRQRQSPLLIMPVCIQFLVLFVNCQYAYRARVIFIRQERRVYVCARA